MPPHGRRHAAALGGLALAAAAAVAGCVDGTRDGSGNGQASGDRAARDRAALPTGIGFLSADGDDDEAFARADAPREFTFPADHGSHPRYRTEWWYFTGNLRGGSGRHFGFELTFFRYALAPEPPDAASAWATNQVWMAHFAVTDTRNDRMRAEERLTRGAVGLAGAQADPFRVWVEGWSVAADDGPAEALRLRSRGEGMELDLRLEPLKPPVANGNGGLDRKGPEPGNASYYYSLTRIDAEGTVSVDGEPTSVEGLAWMDREWSTSALSPGLEGWDWFALQLSDGRDLMVYRLRRRDGGASRFSGGSLVEPDGRRRPLDSGDIDLELVDTWQSPRTGTRYPTSWRLNLPEEDLSLRVRPYVDDQEIDLSVRYWEGAVRVDGTSAGEPVDGSGYLELAGY